MLVFGDFSVLVSVCVSRMVCDALFEPIGYIGWVALLRSVICLWVYVGSGSRFIMGNS